MKTWICTVFGGGTPTYLISAESEKRAWELIKEKWKLYIGRGRCSGLIEVPFWHADDERIDDINELYATNGIIKKGSFEGI